MDLFRDLRPTGAMNKLTILTAAVLLLSSPSWAQQNGQPGNPEPATTGNVQLDRSGSTPIFRVTVVERTTKAVEYRHRSGSTPIDFRGTPLMPAAKGDATVNSKQGRIEINARMEHLSPATQYGPVVAVDVVGVLLVNTNSGYAPDPGHAGTGTVAQVLC